jgi:hypothetical protein
LNFTIGEPVNQSFALYKNQQHDMMSESLLEEILEGLVYLLIEFYIIRTRNQIICIKEKSATYDMICEKAF